VIKADILLDSINESDNRLTTWLLTYPRFIHAEFNTHRMFSRNASSSRAIPIKKMIEAVKNEPAMPVFWGKNQSGMQAAEELDDTIHSEVRWKKLSEQSACTLPMSKREAAKTDWLVARDRAIETVEKLSNLGLHKQLANRLLEPWMHITVVMSTTEMENFFALRAHDAAQPEFRTLAFLMLEKYNASTPNYVPIGGTFDGEMNADKDYEIHDKLAASGHWSPFEHCAEANWCDEWSGNFRGWIQYRKKFQDENRKDARVLKK
jgi:thymidylate synthase ThyX